MSKQYNCQFCADGAVFDSATGEQVDCQKCGSRHEPEPVPCAGCGEAIPPRRLAALPGTRECVRCAGARPQERRKAEFRIDPDAQYPRGW